MAKVRRLKSGPRKPGKLARSISDSIRLSMGYGNSVDRDKQFNTAKLDIQRKPSNGKGNKLNTRG